ncbi:MAG: hypothetical protein JWP89_620 [Schlesneria sp.]|nr:hypothetical protein [Schlesneria sp.]
MLSSWTTPRPGSYRGEDCTVLSWQFQRCTIVAYVMRDAPRVFIAGGETADTKDREADLEEVEALAERFDCVDLKAAATRMRAARERGARAKALMDPESS